MNGLTILGLPDDTFIGCWGLLRLNLIECINDTSNWSVVEAVIYHKFISSSLRKYEDKHLLGRHFYVFIAKN